MNKQFFITAAIPYVNANLHVGNVVDYIQADVLARYHRQNGERVLFAVGTDEYGAKIAEAAANAGLEPQTFTDRASSMVASLYHQLDISYDRLTRTTSEEHKKAAQKLWRQLKGDIYKAAYKGWYCVGCEEYITETEAKANNFTCPDHARAYEMVEEENYFFALSKYSEQIKQSISSDTYRVVPAKRKNEILALLASGLHDISFSRPKTKLKWGIEVPGDSTQVMYVWPEALSNYLTAAGFPKAGYEKLWPADVHIIGKGILRFHAALWPGMLLSAGLPLPKSLFVHGYFTANGQKISKSLGNVVDPLEIVNSYGADALRYYLLRALPGEDDGDFTMQRFIAVYNSELADDLGNLVSRVAAMITQYCGCVVGAKPSPAHDANIYHEALANFRFDLALEEVNLFTKDLNLYIEEEKPWQLAKSDTEHCREVLAYLAANLEHLSGLLAPFMPRTAAKITTVFSGERLQPLSGPLFPKHDAAG